MEKIELKPCPFCGGEAVIHVDDGASVICIRCGCRTPSFRDYYVSGHPTGRAIYRVMEKWNGRVNEDGCS